MFKNLKVVLHSIYSKYADHFSSFLGLYFWEDNIDNLYYGHYNILKNYSGLFLPYKINGEIQHGWAPHSGITSLDLDSKDESLKQKKYYVFNKRNRDIAYKAGYKNVIPIGSPFLYVKNPEQYYSKKKEKSLILFPTHTHEYAGFKDVIKVYRKYLLDLKKIIHNFSTVTLSLGWAEFDNTNIKEMYESEGISITSMGHRDNNPEFLISFIKKVSKFDYVTSDTLSTAVFYSLFMKRKVFLYGNTITKNNTWKKNTTYKKPELEQDIYPQLKWDNFDHTSHSYIAKKELGLFYKKSPQEIRKIFKYNRNKAFNRL